MLDQKYIFYLKANVTYNVMSVTGYTVEYLIEIKALLPQSVHKGPLVPLLGDTVG